MNNIVFYAVLIFLVSCKTQQASTSNPQPSIPVTQISLYGTEWKLVKMYNEDLQSLNPPMTLLLNEDQKKISGFAGCNNFFGSFESDQSILKFKGFGSTKMFCQDKSGLEDKYFKSLEEIQSFKLENEKLFLSKGNQVILEFRK